MGQWKKTLAPPPSWICNCCVSGLEACVRICTFGDCHVKTNLINHILLLFNTNWSLLTRTQVHDIELILLWLAVSFQFWTASTLFLLFLSRKLKLLNCQYCENEIRRLISLFVSVAAPLAVCLHSHQISSLWNYKSTVCNCIYCTRLLIFSLFTFLMMPGKYRCS